ncbi:hypothetical protein NP493_911g00013 [Ridgeia piscesae]|uniref:SGNH hydrolase-type esterase domain-containing protein n=1 Tax=Ridgeia piscesae TaxID=27915 RepID=A0AAD9KM82_RIDPI|nr:hypothetical protein NP493_911g00013 [Ridgeia piscesae]
MQEGDRAIVTVEKDGGTRGQQMKEVNAIGGKMKGRKEVRVDVTKRKSITRMMAGRKEAGKKGTTEIAAGGKVSNQGDAKRRGYSEDLWGIENRKGIYGRLHFAKDRQDIKQRIKRCCLSSGGRIEHVTERVENVLGHGQGGYILVHVGTNNADKDGTTRIVQRYRELVETLKKTRVEQIILSAILPVMRERGAIYINCKRMTINSLIEQMCEEGGVGFVDLLGYFVGKEDMHMRDGLHLSGKESAVFSENLLRSKDSGTGCNYLN